VKIILLTLGLSILVAIALGGRPARLAVVPVRWAWLAFVGLALQLLPPSQLDPIVVPLLLVSFVILVAFLIANLRLRGFELILVGVLLNFLVIGLNSGMPVSRAALIGSDQRATLTYLEEYGGAKHHLADEEDVLVGLGDSIALGAPIRQAISLGDVFTYVGVAVFVVFGMLGRSDRRRVAGDVAPHSTAGVMGDG